MSFSSVDGNDVVMGSPTVRSTDIFCVPRIKVKRSNRLKFKTCISDTGRTVGGGEGDGCLNDVSREKKRREVNGNANE